MTAFDYAAEGGPQSVDDATGIAFLRALQLYGARFLVYPRMIALPSPAAGVDFSVTVPGGVSWVVVSIVGTLVTSAAAANRAPTLAIGDGTVIAGRFQCGNVQVASLTGRHGWSRGGATPNTMTGIADDGSSLPLAPMPPNTVIQAITNNLQAADQWSALGIYTVQVRERTWQEMARYMGDLDAGTHDELFPGFPVGL